MARKTSAQNRRPAHTLARRREILDITRQIITENGFENIRMRELAKRCGVAVTTLYNHFGSRDELIAAVLENDFRGLYGPLSQKTADLPPDRKFISRVVYACDNILAMSDYTATVLTFYFRPKVDPILRSVVHDYVAGDFAGIAQAIAELGELQDWVEPADFGSDVVTQLYAIVIIWLQGYMLPSALHPRLLRAGATAFAGVSKGKTREAFERIAADPLSAIHDAATASAPAIRP
ncbi:hypothetical protein MB02_11840 [Croceicoccus estronivorus]|uniref:TetR/AcrR family transcriptional regulator n=1 Tax=Croceicoccus estronivorus TaxID=1172626 RepID=UPI00083020E1|nr:TetR/AcrR family transcriptional regulator [Croceicoccus estronivorus]OCC23320.1 hypothetical protein MB02_11840 [Croceicoccus estronivorus]